MSESHSPSPDHLDLASRGHAGASGGQPRILQLGGALGIAGCAVGLLVLLGACAGFRAALALSFIPVAFGGIGFILALIGGIIEKPKITEDTHVLAALFATCMAIIGGLVEMAAHRGWQMFAV